MSKALLIVVSAPSGAGKTTLCDMLLRDDANLVYSISCTTRKPRPSEKDGCDYHFLSRQDFEARVAAGEFLEYAEVHGNMYGTLKKSVIDSIIEGKSVLMDIDVQGAAQIRNNAMSASPDDPVRKAFVDIFITVPSIDVLRQRLEGRGEDSPEVIDRRVAAAAREISCSDEYMYVIVNDDIKRAYSELTEVITKESLGG